MIEELSRIIEFMLTALWHIAPYLLLSIPIAVALRMTDASTYIRRALSGHPVQAILLATVVGAFSPFCSCSVIPVVASLLIAGVPLPPVMAFWIASPSMDPEIFVLSAGMLSWEMAVVRLISTLILSLSAGLITWQLDQRGFFKDGILKEKRGSTSWSWHKLAATTYEKIRNTIAAPKAQPATAAPAGGAFIGLDAIGFAAPMGGGLSFASAGTTSSVESSSCGCGTTCSTTPATGSKNRWSTLGRETLSVTVMLLQFMLLAYFLEALIIFYVPQDAIIKSLGTDNPFAVLIAGLLGIPIYTSNLAALPLIDGLLKQGMAPGAALAFLISGPTTTLPAMAAVYGIAKRRVFMVYLAIAVFGSIILGYAYQVIA